MSRVDRASKVTSTKNKIYTTSTKRIAAYDRSRNCFLREFLNVSENHTFNSIILLPDYNNRFIITDKNF